MGRGVCVGGRQEFKDAHARKGSKRESPHWEKPLLLCELKCRKRLAMQQASFHKTPTHR